MKRLLLDLVNLALLGMIAGAVWVSIVLSRSKDVTEELIESLRWQ